MNHSVFACSYAIYLLYIGSVKRESLTQGGSQPNLVRGGLKKKRRRRKFFGGRFYGGFDLKWCPSRALNLASKQESQIKALLRLAATEVVKNHKEIF